MPRPAMVRVRVEPELKRSAETVFAELGLTTSEAIALFYEEVALRRDLPFAARIPNAETAQALQDAHDGKDLIEYESLDALKAALADDLVKAALEGDPAADD